MQDFSWTNPINSNEPAKSPLPQNRNDCFSNERVCTPLKMYKHEVEKKLFLLSQMHHFPCKESREMKESRERMEKRGRARERGKGEKGSKIDVQKLNYSKTKLTFSILYQVRLHFVFQRNSLSAWPHLFSFEVLSGIGSYISSSCIPIEIHKNGARREEEQKIKKGCRKYPFSHLSKTPSLLKSQAHLYSSVRGCYCSSCYNYEIWT